MLLQCLSVPSTTNQPLQQVKANSMTLLRSSPGMGLGGVKINSSRPPMRLGLSRNVRVKPLHSHVSVQHWNWNLKRFHEHCLFSSPCTLAILSNEPFRTKKLNQIEKSKCIQSWNSLPAISYQQQNDLFQIRDSSPLQDSGIDTYTNKKHKMLHVVLCT